MKIYRKVHPTAGWRERVVLIILALAGILDAAITILSLTALDGATRGWVLFASGLPDWCDNVKHR